MLEKLRALGAWFKDFDFGLSGLRGISQRDLQSLADPEHSA
jgi:hypothetical protein